VDKAYGLSSALITKTVFPRKEHKMQPATIIAEIGCSHVGSIERAKKLISLAANAGCHVAKFQKRTPRESVKPELWDKPHPNQMFAYGKTYLEHRINLELTISQHAELKQYCESIGIDYSTSVWDMTSAREVAELNPKFIKIPSACNNNDEMIQFLIDNYSGAIHISLGMTSRSEREAIIKKYDSLYNDKLWDRIVLYHCTSGYPVPFDKLYLSEISWLSMEHCRTVGFSNHGYGIAADIAAYILGATFIERHFIDDRSFRHTDASCSLEPDGIRRLCRDLKNVNIAWKMKPNEIDPLEQEQRNKLRI
jgi:N-acetylneuraminate synthase